MFKMPTAVTVLLVAGLVGLACSSSGLKSNAHDAGVATGGQAGNTISSGTTGATGGTIGSGGTGGASMGGTGGTIGSGGSTGGGGTAGSSGTGGQAGSYPICASIRMCDPTDQQVDGPCPAARECYSFQQECFDAITVCMLPAGVHCSELSCNPGNSPTTVDDQGCSQHPTACYTKQLCAHEIWCRYGADGGVDAGVSDTGVDASGKPEPDSSSPRVGAPHPQPCLPGEVFNFGEMCPCVAGPPLCSYSSCEPRGDGWCYTQCTPPQQGGSCAGGLICGPIMIFGGGDVGYNYYLCNGPIGAPVGGACRSSNDCNAGASCVTSTDCGDASVCSVCQN